MTIATTNTRKPGMNVGLSFKFLTDKNLYI